MAILVTGGAGYIGSIVVEDLLISCGETIVLDNLSRSARNYELNAKLVIRESTAQLLV